MKKSMELYVDLHSADVLYGVEVHVVLDNDGVGIVVGNGGNVLDATHHTYEELGIEVKDSSNSES